MKSNGLLKWLIILLIGLVVVVVVKLRGTSDTRVTEQRLGGALTTEEMKAT